MRGFLFGIALASLAVLSPAPEAAAQSRPAPDCRDDRGVDRCAADVHRRVLDLYGVPPIEEHARAGDQVRRVFYVDGYGRDVVAIAFVRAPGRDPMLSVHFPREAGAVPAPATALVPESVWTQLLARSAYFDRDLAPVSGSANPDNLSICLHAWVYTVEATQPPRDGEAMQVRRKVQDACDAGLATDYAGEIQNLALPLLPYCAALDATQHRNIASLLNACRLLNGDRLAAAGALNLLTLLLRVDEGDRRTVTQVFGQRAILDWAGTQTSGSITEIANAWLRGATEGGRTNLYVGRVTGERAGRVTAEGRLSRYVDGPNDGQVQLVAPVTFQLTDMRDGFGLRVSRATVGAFAEQSRD